MPLMVSQLVPNPSSGVRRISSVPPNDVSCAVTVPCSVFSGTVTSTFCIPNTMFLYSPRYPHVSSPGATETPVPNAFVDQSLLWETTFSSKSISLTQMVNIPS